jgi:hypothetical protein
VTALAVLLLVLCPFLGLEAGIPSFEWLRGENDAFRFLDCPTALIDLVSYSLPIYALRLEYRYRELNIKARWVVGFI